MIKIKFSPVVYVLGLYLLLGAYLNIVYIDFYQYLKGIELIDLTPIAYLLLAFAILLFVLAFFSIFRIPLFHYLFKMVHLWIVIVTGLLVYFYFKYEPALLAILDSGAEKNLAEAFPVSEGKILLPLTDLVQTALNGLRNNFIEILLVIAVVTGVIQVVLYMPSSLRYVYHTHINPFGYTFRHVFVSVIVLAALLFAVNFYMRLDSSMDPQLATLLTTESSEVSDSENAFYPMLTVWMPNVADRTSTGKQWVADYHAMSAWLKKQNRPVRLAEYPPYRNSRLLGMAPADQAGINQMYIQRLRELNFTADKELVKYAERYRAPLTVLRSLYKYKAYRNPTKYTGIGYTEYFTGYDASLLSLHRLNLLSRLAEQDAADKSLVQDVFADYFFNMMVIKESSDPVNRMLYVEKQVITAELLNTLLQVPGYQNQDFYKLINYLPIMDEKVIDFSGIARSKVLYFKKVFDSHAGHEKPGALPGYLHDYLFKYNKTLNCIYDYMSKELNLDAKSPLIHIRTQQEEIPKARLTNIIGDVVCSDSIPVHIRDYYTRAVEANGSILMLKARSTSIEKGIPDINMNVFLNDNSEKYYNPFTKEALKWDREKKRIYFEYNNGQENLRVQL